MADDFNLFPASGSSTAAGGSTKIDFPMPWLDYASATMPNSLTLVLRWAEYIWNSNGSYREACRRTVRYFITEIMFKDVDDHTAQEIRDILENQLKLKQRFSELGDSFVEYGNVFCQLSSPFERYLVCDCGFFTRFDVAHEKHLYEWKEYEFQKSEHGCPQCGSKHQHKPWHIKDVEDKDPGKLKLILRSPHEIEIGYDPYSGDKEFYWNIPAALDHGVSKGVAVVLRNAPKVVIEACRTRDRRIKFDPETIFHFAEPGSAGMFMGGWGLPRVMSNFRLAYHYQTLNRYDMAIAMDYINGMRVISPDQSSQGEGAGDPLVGVGGSLFNRNITKMVAQHRRDPATWHIAPVPLKYQLFGGEGQQLSPKDLLQYKLNEWLDATGIPAELYHGTLSVQAAPIAIRIFENSWPEIQSLYNAFIAWLGKYMTQVLKVPEFQAQMLRPSLADDLERRQIMLQLMAGNQVSPQTAMQAFGITDPREEIRRAFEWQAMAAEEEKTFQEKMQQLADSDMILEGMAQRAAGQAPGGTPGAPMPGGAPAGGAPMDPAAMGGMGGPQVDQEALKTPESMVGEADRLAQQIIQMGEGYPRRKALLDLRKTNEVLADLVKGRIKKLEQQAAQQGVSFLRTQGGGA